MSNSAYVIYQLLTTEAPESSARQMSLEAAGEFLNVTLPRMSLALEAAQGAQPLPVVGEQVAITASKPGEYGNFTFLVEVVGLRRHFNVEVRDHPGNHNRDLGFHTAYVRLVEGPTVPF